MQKSQKQEITKVQEMIDEYQHLWKDIQERIVTITFDLQKQVKLQTERLRREKDESVQVDTLKFEQDTGIQVDTLTQTRQMPLQRMTSISAKDAYLMELNSALNECNANVTSLEALIGQEVANQGSPELHMSAKKIAKLTATCQSSVELIEHLKQVLIDECDATDEEAKTEEVEFLVKRFTDILGRAKAKEQKIRELR